VIPYQLRALRGYLWRQAGDPRGFPPEQRVPVDVVAPEGDDGTAGNTFDVSDVTGDYRFWLAGQPGAIVKSTDEVNEILWQYSSHGDGLTQAMVARAHGLTRRQLNGILKALAFTKSEIPYTDAQIAERDEDEIASEIASLKRARIDRKAHAKLWRDVERDAASWRALELSTLQYVAEAVAASAPGPVVARDIRRAPESFALLIPVTDLHIGKISWGGYGPGAFSTIIAQMRLGQAVDSILAWLPGAPAEIILPIGGDFFQCDNVGGTTGRGTPQDIDGTPEKMIVEGFGIAFALVAELAAVAPVTLVYNRGNHDPALSLALFRALELAHKDSDRVKVLDAEDRYSPYQCMVYGVTAIGFAHGDGRSKPHELATLMAQRWPGMWAATERREWHLGHVHHLRTVEDSGVTLLTNPSLSGSDRYHEQKWPVAARPQLAAHVYDLKRGRIATVYGVCDE